ncbi:MAG: sigma-54-dependent Fis family transcriptional regulator [Deltaproteobacteria bacterium]|nr:sigma-54-dependent Fis family transcriptional regulator [Deltaproteobacteria bacterium]
MYSLIRKHNQFCFVKNGLKTDSDAIIKSIFSPKWYGSTWQLLSRTEKKTWIDFLKSGQVNDPSFNKKIEQSWRRSQQAEVDPFRGVCEKFLSPRKMKGRSEKIIVLAKPIMDTLYHCVRGSRFVIVLIDKEGYILRTVGALKELRQADKLRFGPGANWGEEFVGTNAIGTALALGHPVQITGPEHYCETHHLWTCSAAPIRKQNGEIVGFLDISGPRELSTVHQLGLVVAAAHAIEDRIVLDESYDQLYNTNKYLEAVLNSVSDGIIAVNAQGIITGLNKVAAKIFRLHPKEVVGQTLTASIYHNGRLQNFFKTRSAGMTKEEVRLKMPCGQRSCVATANPVFSEKNDNRGFVLTLSPTNRSYFSSNKPEDVIVRFRFVDIIGESDAIRHAIEKAKSVAPGPSTVLILGESGTGKELFAQAIHGASDCHCGPFVPVNCGAIPKELIQSELFGYADGAFTGAKRGGCTGKFESANGGTLFLDEIGEMPLEMQINLLRVLEEKIIMPVGGKKAIPLNVRIIAATNKSLFEEVTKGRFREDLYYRLNVISITLPSLKVRQGDIELLTRYWVDRISRKMGKKIKQIEPEALIRLENYHWPGNVRELVNALESAVNFMTDDTLAVKNLPACFRKKQFEKPQFGEDRIPTLRSLEKDNIKKALLFYKGNITRSAKVLGIGRNTLYEKMKKYGIG